MAGNADSSGFAFEAVHETRESSWDDISVFKRQVVVCMDRTMRGLQIAGLATDEEMQKARQRVEQQIDMGNSAEFLVELAHVRSVSPAQMSGLIEKLSLALADTLPSPPPLIPFAGKLIAPNHFYETFEQLHRLGRALLCPILYAEEADVIGVGSINPMVAKFFTDEVRLTVERRLRIRPFMTTARMDFDGWMYLTRKQFGA